MDIDIARVNAYAKDTPFVTSLHSALEQKTNIALILGLIDDIARIRDKYGLASCDDALQKIEQILYARFGECSLRTGEVFLVLITGDEAAKAPEIAESIRAVVENHADLLVPSLAGEPVEFPGIEERVHITMHFGVTRASSDWTSANGFDELVQTAQDTIDDGQRRLIANRVFA